MRTKTNDRFGSKMRLSECNQARLNCRA